MKITNDLNLALKVPKNTVAATKIFVPYIYAMVSSYTHTDETMVWAN